MIWREVWKWIRRRGAVNEASVAQESADESHALAERDWMAAIDRRMEATRVTEALRAHNTANRYDDWLREIVRR